MLKMAVQGAPQKEQHRFFFDGALILYKINLFFTGFGVSREKLNRNLRHFAF